MEQPVNHYLRDDKQPLYHTCVTKQLTVLEVGGAEGLVRDMISWMARRSLRRCKGLLMPISRWISVSDSADMMAPLFTLARQAATYQAGMPTHSWHERAEDSDVAPITAIYIICKYQLDIKKYFISFLLNLVTLQS